MVRSFYYAPDQQQNPQLLALLHTAQWQDEAIFLSDTQKLAIQAYFSEQHLTNAEQDYQQLFIDPDALPVALGDRFI